MDRAGRLPGWITARQDPRLALCCGSTGSTMGVPCLSQEVYLLRPRRVRLV